ncbi:ABC transporter ATP-binding protein [Clostridium oryzae]|uniref:Multidrug resistance ABC transporter ATP-binding/permease protein BmrA n=1 Tax=Clostridium oryzae TaxID=1450648 RepID=A0A1V4IYB1_9CLOT|nr:ABC transporter ATP-binding protein [Clostridium oryzae]OPJ64889.1 multidrug resistance ABC transporter ATP-binding/permease protein BmrA [Clostridium oryzae]
MSLLYKLILKRKKLSIIYAISGIAIAFLAALNVKLLQKLIDEFTSKNVEVSSIVLYGTAALVSCIINYFDEYPKNIIENAVYFDFKIEALKKISRMDYAHYEKLGTGQLIQKIENGADAGKSMLFNFYFELIRNIVPNITFSLIFIATINIKIMMLITAGYIFVFIFTNLVLKYLYKIKERVLVDEEFLNNNLIRGFMEMPVFRINGKFKNEIDKAKEQAASITHGKTKMVMIHEMFFTVFALITILIKLSIIIYAFVKRDISVGEIVALITFIENAYNPIAIFNVIFVQYKLDKVTFKRYIEIMNIPEDQNLFKGSKVEVGAGDIKFENVRFSHTHQPFIENLTFHICSGKSIAIVGESGSGKSTIVKQIVGLIKPLEGKITVDGQNLKDIKLEHYYRFISYTSQESPIFQGTLRENIVFNGKVPDKKIEKAIELVGLKDFYSKLECGLNTQVGEKGIMLSGGERQRLALARVYFQKAPIVILDEATSALDNITEKLVINNVMKFLKGSTIIIVAHRLNTIQKADSICVLKQGQIVGKGSFRELLDNNDYFKKLWLAGKN